MPLKYSPSRLAVVHTQQTVGQTSRRVVFLEGIFQEGNMPGLCTIILLKICLKVICVNKYLCK